VLAESDETSRGAKPVQLFTQKENSSDDAHDDEVSEPSKDEANNPQAMKLDDENPF